MKNVAPSWFVRQEIINSLEENVVDIARLILDLEVQWYGEDDKSAEDLADCITMFMDLTTMTGDEVQYVLQHVVFYAGMGYLYRIGKISDEQANELDIPESLKNSQLEV